MHLQIRQRIRLGCSRLPSAVLRMAVDYGRPTGVTSTLTQLPSCSAIAGESGMSRKSEASWKSTSIFVSLCLFEPCVGGPGEIRTHDLLHAI
jgi:hypothetical protein